MKDEVSKQSDYDPALQLEAYLVGGAVRDRLLGLDSSDRDYVVVGATPAIMEKLGFKPVGRDFPVFLHPGTGDEYALARMERKTAPGYRGFTVDAAKDVTLEDDLARRDLTINAMAMTWAGEIIDPYGGQRDLRNKCLRHVSPAFAEDPVRILRVARFFARYQHLGFKVADETRALMRRISESDELDALVAERVWTETRRALDEHTPSAFFLCLRDCGALSRLFPEVDRLFGVPQTKTYHPEIDTGRHVMMALDMAARLGANTQSRFAVLCHDFGKALTPRDILPRHRGHELRGLEPLNDVCERLKVPNDYKRLARVVCREHLNLHRLTTLRAATVVKLLDNLGVFHGEDMCADFTLCCEADARGRLGREETDYPQARLLAAFAAATRRVDSAPFLARGLSGPQLGEAIRQHRIDIVAELSRQHRAP